MAFYDPSHPLGQLLLRDSRYKVDAYLFVLESLSYAQDTLGFGAEPPEDDLEPRPADRSRRGRRRTGERHLTGQQLCEAARRYAMQQYGFMARTVLATWGVHSTRDFGEIVFNMIDIGQMRKTRKDKREDFHGIYDFDEAFCRNCSFVVPDPA